MTKQEAIEQISKLVNEAFEAISQAEGIACEHNVGFSFDLTYGMGGYFDGETGDWNPSSLSC